MEKDLAQSTLEIASSFEDPTGFVHAILFDTNNNVKEPLLIQIKDLSYIEKTEKVIHCINKLTTLWKLGQVYRYPDKSNEEIANYGVDIQYILSGIAL